MLKKIALGALLTGLVAVLILGAVIRTQAKTGESAAEAGGRYRDLASQSTTYEGNGGRWSETNDDAATLGGRWDEANAEAVGGGGRWSKTNDDAATLGGRWDEANAEAVGRGGRWQQTDETEEWQRQGLGSTNAEPQADVQPAEWQTLAGTVTSVADELVEIELATGEVIPFEGQPLRYAISEGLALTVGDVVTLSGFEEDGEFKIGQVTADGATITLRDESGRPGWSGRGRRS